MQPPCNRTIPETQVIIAALNEEHGIGPTISELKSCLFHPNIIVVDGQSTDGTVEIAKNLLADVYIQNGKGKGNAIAKAIELLDPTVKYAVITDADFTYPAKYIPNMIRLLDNNPDVGMVCGNRFSEKVDKTVVKKIFYMGNRLIALVHNLLNGISLDDPLTGLRVVRTEILKEWHIKSNGFDIEVELNKEVERRGFDIIEVPIIYRARVGDKKLRVRDGAQIFSRILAETLK